MRRQAGRDASRNEEPDGGAEGFEGFELLRPTDEREQWLVITRWRGEESFQAWVSSPRPVSTHSEVWSYEVVGGSDPKPA